MEILIAPLQYVVFGPVLTTIKVQLINQGKRGICGEYCTLIFTDRHSALQVQVINYMVVKEPIVRKEFWNLI